MRILSKPAAKRLLHFLLRRIDHRPPDFVIGGERAPYMRRWWILPRNRLFNIYLHQVLRDDDDRALHDHPWCSASLILAGGYVEVLKGGRQLRQPGSLTFRRAVTPHRLELIRPDYHRMESRVCWSLFITGPRVRQWGFHCAKGWIHFKDFVAEDPGQIGAGCDGPISRPGTAERL
ncbi:hypothetical protein [Fodinicurvata fenggangensis]|uniref:hypothetical protein n=1 Tax=Fodinicurvata fenggangensis TaxID=1121830 RepID=UPI00068C4151|nr:hypothetical protein [Fodinicurvata fenggangensis]